MKVANCPSCGGPLEFSVGSSIVRVCDHCRSVVARKDREVTDLGKIAALIETGSLLRLGLMGSYRGDSFRLLGRTQLRHESGAVWDEWYAAFSSGVWGWIAEDEGKFLVTFESEAANVPAEGSLSVGQQVGSVGSMKVVETGRAEVVSAEGEIPWRAVPGSSYTYADLSGAGGAFATIDYSDARPAVFKGKEATALDLGIADEELRTSPVAVSQLSCAKCGAALPLIAPDKSERVICSHCGSSHNVTEGKLKAFQVLKQRNVNPLIPIGTIGTIGDSRFTVAGFMQRRISDGEESWKWTEYLLYNPRIGFRYLVHDENHWSLATGVPAGDVEEPNEKQARWSGKRFRLFETGMASVTYVAGEFPWKVEIGEKVEVWDFIAPPEGLSKEVIRSGSWNEVNWSVAVYMTPEEVETAFGVKDLAQASGVGAMQPYAGPRLEKEWAAFVILLVIAAILISIKLPGRTVLRETVAFSTSAVEGVPGVSRRAETKPFELSGNRNVRIKGYADLANNQHLAVRGEIGPEAFELWTEYATGSDDEGTWVENDRLDVAHLSALPAGRYVLELNAEWSHEGDPPPLHLEVDEGVFRGSHLLLALIAISLIPMFTVFRRTRWEMERWKESDHSPFALAEDDDDE